MVGRKKKRGEPAVTGSDIRTSNTFMAVDAFGQPISEAAAGAVVKGAVYKKKSVKKVKKAKAAKALPKK